MAGTPGVWGPMDLSRTPAASTTERPYEAGSCGRLSLCLLVGHSGICWWIYHYPGGAPGRAVAKHVGVAGHKPRDSEDAKTRSCLPALAQLVLLSKGRGKRESLATSCLHSVGAGNKFRNILFLFHRGWLPSGSLDGIKSLLIAETSGL